MNHNSTFIEKWGWIWRAPDYTQHLTQMHQAMSNRYPGWTWNGRWPITDLVRIADDPVRWVNLPANGRCVWDGQGSSLRCIHFAVRPIICATVDMSAMHVGWRLLWNVGCLAGIVSAWRALRLLRAVGGPSRQGDIEDWWIRGRRDSKYGRIREKTRC